MIFADDSQGDGCPLRSSGYDYAHQCDYLVIWERVVTAFREICDAYPDLKVSLEFKPTDENTRFFAVPSTGAAILLVEEINRENMGLTLDIGHCLMAGENPAQSAAMVGSRGKLFGVQLNDGYQRLGAEVSNPPPHSFLPSVLPFVPRPPTSVVASRE